ncbi:hypothetical protein DFH07DRAFT_870478 [Mycena maculata]|uniref:CxC2-like cysteine cluster KDZ transposase-associated domain-containing protein n=1 Tax=Mycena maculata TaxID=230809 RepID=A0AAD7MYM0_9AGAR|nr:hypothetical protein DFH07DRAFT_870478 [Mycena maculata]
MTDAYLALSLATADTGEGLPSAVKSPEDVEVQENLMVLVVDMFSATRQSLALIHGDSYVASACVRQGWMPSAPSIPTVVITIRVLEVYRVADLRCPRLGIQVFVRTLCDIHGVAPRRWLGTQFSVAFDVYLAIQARVDSHVQLALGRDTPHWRLKNACPCCLYNVEGEPKLKITFIGTQDGNNSLSRFAKREREVVDETAVPGASKEQGDDRVAPGDYYLPREEVDKWAKEGLEELVKTFGSSSTQEEMEAKGGVEEEEGCSERWQNMKEDVTARAYGMYDETGFFPALCRHGFVLIVVDMVKSGKLYKYPLLITAHILNVLGEVGLAYDVRCKHGKTVRAHPALRQLALDKNFRSLVGAFHGHGHNRLCGLRNLMTYVEGVGLEAGEGCEIFFSKSKALASTTRYASRFHRQQSITTYLKHTDTFDTYANLSLLLCNNTMRDLGVESRDVFEMWLAAEKAHLLTLSKEPEEETLEMEYFQKLVNLRDAEERVTAIIGVQIPFIPGEPHTNYAEMAKATQRIETQRRHALELEMRARVAVQDLEISLGVDVHWRPEDENWSRVSAMVRSPRYQRALDHLQGLIISRMFELAKCNMSGTGYKLRKHIAKALQARSKAIKTAIERYNDIAEAMTPPKPSLTWLEVVEYAFLADFDLLREGREDIRGQPWAQPAGRAAMDPHFKLLRADEEIQRLNVEIRCFVTYIVDEEAFLLREEEHLRMEGNEVIAHQVRLVRMERSRFTDMHMSRLVKLSREPGFTGCILPGTSLSRERHTPVMQASSPLCPLRHDAAPPGNDEENAQSDDDEGILAGAFMNIIHITGDDGADTEDT